MVSRFDGVTGVIPVSLMIWTTYYVGTRHLHSMVFRSRISFSFLHWHTFTQSSIRVSLIDMLGFAFACA